jgi:hypothetical protein
MCPYFSGENTVLRHAQIRTRAKALDTFFNVDGQQGHLVMPNPHRHDSNKEAYDRLSVLSVKERLRQISNKLSEIELAYCAATCINWCGMDLSKASFFDCMRWWSLAGYHPDGITHCAYSYKLECGQTGLARPIFDDICSYPNVSYTFNTPVCKIGCRNGVVDIETVGGRVYRGKQLICTIPWAVLDTITFEPGLPRRWQECIENLNMGHSMKVYAEVEGTDWDAWSYLTVPGNPKRSLAFAATSGVTTTGDTRMVLFSLRDEIHEELNPLEDPEATIASLRDIKPELRCKRLVSTHLPSDPVLLSKLLIWF